MMGIPCESHSPVWYSFESFSCEWSRPQAVPERPRSPGGTLFYYFVNLSYRRLGRRNTEAKASFASVSEISDYHK